jgi:hypothetical protein
MEDEMGWACSINGTDEKFEPGFVGKTERKRPLGRPRTILKWILGKQGWRVWIRFICLRLTGGELL